ncbi:MAG TPA: tryptophan halogenase family protein [Sphingomicrobium sp.]|nr:tryptophan halogenase family protein [Sphingomicrobium sp.]
MTDPSPLNLVIAGGGTAGWMAAAAMSRFLGSRASITLVESEEIGTVGVGEATIPQIHLFVGGLGIDGADLVRETKATYKLGIEFEGWLRPGHRYMHAFGIVGRAAGIVPFRQLWHKARAEGAAGDFGEYSFNEVAARAERMAIPEGAQNSPFGLVNAYHFDASLFAVMLRRYAEERGVVRVEGKIEQALRDPETGDLTALALDGDREVEGNFFIDCTGFRSLLLGEALGVGFKDWSTYLPCDRALAVPSERSEALRPYTMSMARKAGWQWRIPLQHRTGNGHVYSSEFISDDEAASILLANLDGRALDDPRPLRFKAGQRELSWSHNCVALGLSAGFLEPLESTSIHLVQSSIARLLTYLPRGSSAPAARDKFNRVTAKEWEQIRDFIILHYKANRRVGEPFWDRCRTMEIPATLAEKIALFEESALLVRDDNELFTEEGWGQVMIGQGIEPRTYSPLADSVPSHELAQYLAQLAQTYRRAADALPTHARFVDSMLANAPASKEPVA